MDATMEQNVADISQLDQNVQIIRKEVEPWFEDRHVDTNQEQQPLIQSSYFKYQSNIDNFNQVPPTIPWWKGSGIVDMNSQTEYQQEEISTANYALIDHTVLPQSQNFLQDVELNTKKPVKGKQPKKPRMIKEHREPVKRTKHPEQWKVNIKKNARLRGEEYIGVGGKIVPAKIMGPPCKCRMRCTEKINEAAREELHNVFWKTCTWEQRKQYVALSVKESPKQRTRCRGNVKSEHRRQVTFTYSLLLKGEFITVCKCMFLSTFAVSEKFVRHAMDKKRTSPGGIIGPDQRGRHTPKTKKSEAVKERVRDHINSFPTERSVNSKDRTGKRYLDSRLSIAAMHKLYVTKCKEDGVPESDIVKESYYREMFKTEFNLGFKRGKSKEKKPSPVVGDNRTKAND